MRPSRDEYQNLLEVFRTQKKVNFTEAANFVGVPRETAERAYKRGWPGNKTTGYGALHPIRDVIEQETVTASAVKRQVLDKLGAEHEQILLKAMQDGVMQKALEGVVSSTFLAALDKQMQNVLKLVTATTPLVDKMVNQIMLLAADKGADKADIDTALSFVTSYGRETAFMLKTYAEVEKIRQATMPEKIEESKDVIDPSKLSPKEAIDAMLEMFQSAKAALPEMKMGAVAPTVIDVTPLGQSSSASSKLSSSSSSESDSNSSSESKSSSSQSSSSSSSNSRSSSSSSSSSGSSSSRSSSSGPLKLAKF